jgi:crotonobetainyl-CoA:carnitine CoA-transferase CaiB-like acyl-CoA transferase
MSIPASQLPLARFSVLDLTRVRAGPTCVRVLADWGANVIKIEQPPSVEGGEGLGGPRDGSDFQNLHRNKRSLTLNLKEKEGLAIFMNLVKKADVVVENYRADVKDRLGIDYESLRKVNPRIILGSISGFGQSGPYRDRPGFDQVAQGMGGLMWITGLPGQGPVRVGIPVADLSAGIFCAQGILLALLEREVSGQGQWVHTSLLQAQIAMLDFQATRWTMDGEVAPQAGNNHPTSIPTGVFQTEDGYINIAVAGQEIWERFCKAIGATDWLADARFKTGKLRSTNRDALNPLIAEYLKHGTSQKWIDQLNEAGVPCGPIYKMNEVFADPQVKHLGIAQEIAHPKRGKVTLVGQPMVLERTNSSLRTAPPELGQHTDEILGELGMNAEEIAGLRQKHVI